MKGTVLVLGSGPIRIGQGIEFDYSCVHCVWALQKLGYRAILLNNNPETVSTDFDTADALYFEPVTLDDVLGVAAQESVQGVICQFGGQTAINLSQSLYGHVPILGTSSESIAAAEDRDLFDQMLMELQVPKPRGRAVRSLAEAKKVAEEVGFPVLVRPSFVLGGRAMEIVHDDEQLDEFYAEADQVNPGHPVLIDQYIQGIEAEIDAICDGETTLIPGIMEHIERAGVHSGDSMAVYPPRSLSAEVQQKMVDYAARISQRLSIRGLMNIQFVILDDEPYVIEVNPRASRTVPFLSKVTGIPMVALATAATMGEKLAEYGYSSGLWVLDATLPIAKTGLFSPDARGKIWKTPWTESLPTPLLYAVKAPVFSFQKLAKVDPALGPEMKSTGEVMGIDFGYEAALYKAIVASGINFKLSGKVLLTLRAQDKEFAKPLATALIRNGFEIVATSGTHRTLSEAGISATAVKKIQEGSPNILDSVRSGEVTLMINTPSIGKQATKEAIQIRRSCIENGIPCITNADTALALAESLELFRDRESVQCRPVHEYLEGHIPTAV